MTSRTEAEQRLIGPPNPFSPLLSVIETQVNRARGCPAEDHISQQYYSILTNERWAKVL